MSMCVLLCKDMFYNDTFTKFPEDRWIMLVRFTCGVVLHMNADTEIA